MSLYEKIFKKPYPNGWKDKPNKTTPIKGAIMDAYDAAIESIENELVKHYETFADKGEIPTKISQLYNDKGYAIGTIPTSVSQLNNDLNFATEYRAELIASNKVIERMGDYVSKSGDEMTGDLEMKNASIFAQATDGSNVSIEMTADADSTVGIEMNGVQGENPTHSELTDKKMQIGYKDGTESDDTLTRAILRESNLLFEDTDGWWGMYEPYHVTTNESFYDIGVGGGYTQSGNVLTVYSDSNSRNLHAYKPTDLGSSNNKWNNVYATNGTIQTSDRNEKNSIADMTAEQAQVLIYGLKPSTYQMNSGTSGRTHWGMISQDIEELLESLGWKSTDFAGFIKSPKVEVIEIEDEKGRIKRTEKIIEGEYTYSLRYDEFVAPLIKVVQEQRNQITKLGERLAAIESKLA